MENVNEKKNRSIKDMKIDIVGQDLPCIHDTVKTCYICSFSCLLIDYTDLEDACFTVYEGEK